MHGGCSRAFTPREPSQERNSSSNNSSSNNSSKASNNGIGDEDQNIIDELDELGVNDNPVSFLSQVSKLVQQANSKVYNVMGRIAGDAAAKKSGSTSRKYTTRSIEQWAMPLVRKRAAVHLR